MQNSSSERWSIYQIIKSGMIAVDRVKKEGYLTNGKIPWFQIKIFVDIHKIEIKKKKG